MCDVAIFDVCCSPGLLSSICGVCGDYSRELHLCNHAVWLQKLLSLSSLPLGCQTERLNLIQSLAVAGYPNGVLNVASGLSWPLLLTGRLACVVRC